MSNTIAFPTLISYDADEKSVYKYLVFIPDLEGYTQGESLADAITMARDYIGTFSLDNPLPEPGTVKYTPEHGDIVTFVDIDPAKYKRELDKTPVKKTLTIPSYLNDAAIQEGLNFSQTLSEAIKEKLSLA
ncbi:type II toxin-antitoxin system HicB family antitoxin [Lactovum odontotermitis]